MFDVLSCHVCIYRDSSTNADLVLMPYNYLVDTSIRATLKVNWDNSIVIFDEAHNLESVATDATSFSLTSTDIAACISELQQVIRLLQIQYNNDKSKLSDMDQGKSKNDNSGGNGQENAPNLDLCVHVLSHLFNLEKRIDSIPLSPISNMGNTVGKVLQGRWLLDVMENCGFTVDKVSLQYISHYFSLFLTD